MGRIQKVTEWQNWFVLLKNFHTLHNISNSKFRTSFVEQLADNIYE